MEHLAGEDLHGRHRIAWPSAAPSPAFAILSRTELLLAFIGGLFVLITLSVIIQVGYFKVTKGKRFFKMAPLQHHFELKGWAEVTVVVRFWILADCCRRGPGHLLRRMGGPAVTGPILPTRLQNLVSWDSDWSGLRVVVTGIGVSGFAAADTLIELGARVVVVDAATTDKAQAQADTSRSSAPRTSCWAKTPCDPFRRSTGMKPDLIVTSPGWRPDQALLAAAARAHIPVWGDVELAWRLRNGRAARPPTG